MSPLKRKKLNKIRLKLDKLDNSLIKLIKQRTNLVNQVLKLKDKKKEIIDNKIIKITLKNTLPLGDDNNFYFDIENFYFLNILQSYYLSCDKLEDQ